MSKLLWSPTKEAVSRANLTRFIEFVNRRHDRSLAGYNDLYQWSVEAIPDFWAALWDFLEIRHTRTYDRVVDDVARMPGAGWFTGAELNFAENLLRYRDDQPALIFKGENHPTRRISYAELSDQVTHLAKSLKDIGVIKGGRVAGFMPNMIETVVAMLAAASLGAIWSSCSPDFGSKGVLDRFGQIEPKVMFTADGYYYQGKAFNSLERAAAVMKSLPKAVKLVVVPYVNPRPDLRDLPRAVSYPDFISHESGLKPNFVQVPFSHPLYIMYSSFPSLSFLVTASEKQHP
ncbi:MAG: AMP-binding protein, partial [Deltaproteobacteria bacterium]|nr:AMP-binding protein [Deltaproteobacteria bacterium]